MELIQEWTSPRGVKCYSMYIKCPVCFERGINVGTAFWVHGKTGCDGELYMGSDAKWYCPKCKREGSIGEGRIIDLQYKCPTHSTADREYAGPQGGTTTYAAVISCAGQLVTKAGVSWMRSFLANLEG